MFEKRERRWEKLVEASQHWPENSFHDHKEIAGILGVQYGDKSYSWNVSAARNRLLEKRILWICIRDAGYRVAMPDEFTESVRNNIKGAVRSIKRAVTVDIAAPVDRMTPEGKYRHTTLSDRLKVHAAMMSGIDKEVRMLADPKIKMTR